MARFEDFELSLDDKGLRHDKTNIFLVLSRLFERSFYFGIRSVLVIYAVSESLRMKDAEAAKLYGFFAMSVIFAQIIGGLLGDLWVGNKKMSFFGGLLQAFGAFVLCIPQETTLYIGAGMISIGTGIYSSNFMAVFVQSYFSKFKLLDAGFTLVYGIVNIGTLIGVLAIAYLSDSIGFVQGFVLAGLFMLLSLLFLYLSKIPNVKDVVLPKIHLKIRISTLLYGIIAFMGFWYAMNITSPDVAEMDRLLKFLSGESFFRNYQLRMVNPIIVTFGSIVLFALWTFYNIKSSTKIIVGLLIGLISFFMLFSVWSDPEKGQISIFVIALTMLAVAELFITPIFYSVIAKYIHPKFLATAMAFIVLIARATFLIADQFHAETSFENSNNFELTLILLTLLIGLGFLFHYLRKRIA